MATQNKGCLKRALIPGVIILMLGFTTFITILTNPFAGPAKLQRQTSQITDKARVTQDVVNIIATGDFRNWRNPDILDATAQYIRQQWQAAGFEVTTNSYQVKHNTYHNLSILYGDADKPRLVVGAHYDVFSKQDGADDNASSVAAILEVARMLAQAKPQLPYQLELVAFTLEEPPFFRSPEMGSARHAQQLISNGIPVTAMISLDCIGYFSDAPNSQSYPAPGLGMFYPSEGNFIAVVGRVADWRLTRKVKALMRAGSELPVYSMNAPANVPGIDFSDHHNYWPHKITAVLITNSAYYRNDRYHTSNDTADTLDYTRLTQVIQSVYTIVTNFD